MNVLVADDDPVSCRLVGGILARAGYAVQQVATGEAALACARGDDGPRLLVLDWVMPGLTGPEVIRLLREEDPDTFRYAILLTLRHRATDLVAGLQSGADDYVRKPCDPRELVARVQVGERMLALQARLAASHQALEQLASTDMLTELLNRRSLLGGLEQLAADAARAGRPLGLAMLDIDHFKRINDTWGHPVGDQVLRALAGRLAHLVRAPDLVGRYGGEEFMVVLDGVAPPELLAVGDRLLRAVREDPVATAAGALAVTTSVGLACRLPGAPLSVADLLKQADDALYQAKRDGRDRARAAWDAVPVPARVERAA